MPPKIRDIRDIRDLRKRDGWSEVAQGGSHRQSRHPVKPGPATVPGKPGDDVPPGTLNCVFKQTGLRR
ncbi:addiction module toxin, HicA family [Luteimonas aestuarii]|uniref:Addiction module toxin, HicA family n=1 Tax=Luteimonas aestuarii TaxID=453837 RepID=A0A4R5TSW2_9GAMM|nr:type II toxin-antitoxin system HicA family toxin [Luteimonas aestuarii]TDK21069.1 addiction module toxin, HicA family [Luteimonas aestuarii]